MIYVIDTVQYHSATACSTIPNTNTDHAQYFAYSHISTRHRLVSVTEAILLFRRTTGYIYLKNITVVCEEMDPVRRS
jgi:hypothetical protein